jgi:D-hydroxyproline dehydrogenase subunit alpha
VPSEVRNGATPSPGRSATQPRIAVVGAGIAGLACTVELSPRASVTIIDRLPTAGGVLGYEQPLVRELAREARAAGAVLALGTTATRWVENRLLLVGPDGIRWLTADTLVYAGGTRPATLAEGPVTGSRLAGVLPAPVAEHLLEAEVLLGHRVAVAGGGHWAAVILKRLAHHSCQVIFVAEDPDSARRHEAEVTTIDGWRVRSISGRDRVSEAVLERGDQRMRLACDALILAGGERPLRNVDGAIFDPAPSVVYVQPHGPDLTAADVAVAARRMSRELLSELDGAIPAPGKVS